VKPVTMRIIRQEQLASSRNHDSSWCIWSMKIQMFKVPAFVCLYTWVIKQSNTCGIYIYWRGSWVLNQRIITHSALHYQWATLPATLAVSLANSSRIYAQFIHKLILESFVFWAPCISWLLITFQMSKLFLPFCGLPFQTGDHFFHWADDV
jgi:hypothetical protein